MRFSVSRPVFEATQTDPVEAAISPSHRLRTHDMPPATHCTTPVKNGDNHTAPVRQAVKTSGSLSKVLCLALFRGEKYAEWI